MVVDLGVIVVLNELGCGVIPIWHRFLSLMLPCAWT